jgi:DNA-3-methyladenine glycosylase
MYTTESHKLTRAFYERDPLVVSKDLLGKLIVRKMGRAKIVGEIVETEAYIGPYDKASHVYGNRKTSRTLVQFKKRGCAYIFRVYGIHYCFCIVVGPPYVPAVTLIRAVRPVTGIDIIRQNRNLNAQASLHLLSNGPAKFCQGFRITDQFNGIDLTSSNELFLCEGEKLSFQICQSARIGIDYAEEFKDMPWRFYIKNSKFVSK